MVEERRPMIAVYPAAAHVAHARLFAALEDACAVRIVAGDDGPSRCQAEIVIGPDAAAARLEQRPPGRQVLALAASGPTVRACVRVERSDNLDSRLHRIELINQQIAPTSALDAEDEVLAVTDAGPVWTRAHAAPIYRVAAGLPILAEDEVLRAALGSDRPHRMLATIAIVAFLREVADDAWEQPPLRATFVFDDPNLRLMRYGHIDYRVLWDEAARHGYHVGMAMVPIDAGRPSSEAVSIFHHHREQLSLSIHGNDHVSQELLTPRDPADARALVAQALRRVTHFERRTELAVGRVMVPPHGMCSREIVGALGALGFDGLCSLHPTPWTDKAAVDRPLAGWTPATFVDGCAVIPRVPLHVTNSELAVRAYLGQPLVLYGHHGDVADGYDLLAEAAARVDRLGDVEWLSLSRLVRSNYQLRVSDGTAHIRPWGTRLDVELPASVQNVAVELAPHADVSRFGIEAVALEEPLSARHQLNEPMLIHGGSRITIRMLPGQTLNPQSVPRQLTHPRAWARRRAAELRDQIAPAARRASKMMVRR
jgi:hypothetical protein